MAGGPVQGRRGRGVELRLAVCSCYRSMDGGRRYVNRMKSRQYECDRGWDI